MEVVQELPLLLPLPTAFIVKAFFALFALFYLVFSILLIRQVHLMTSSIKIPLETLFNFLAYLNLLLTILLALMAIVFL